MIKAIKVSTKSPSTLNPNGIPEIYLPNPKTKNSTTNTVHNPKLGFTNIRFKNNNSAGIVMSTIPMNNPIFEIRNAEIVISKSKSIIPKGFFKNDEPLLL